EADEKKPYDCMAAMGTPMKFTRSFPAKARASAKVPIMMMTFRIFVLKTRCMSKENKVQKTKLTPKTINWLSLIHALVSLLMKETPFNPFIKIKKVIKEIANPPNNAPKRFTLCSDLNVNNNREKY